LSYGNTLVQYHLASDGVGRDRGHMQTNFATMGLTYGVSDRLALSAGLPYVVSKYYGPAPHTLPTDNGDFHGTFSDYRIDVRYQALKAPLVLTPFVATIIPSHDYTYFAHSAVGRHVREYLLGTYFAKILDPVVPNTYVQGRYSYAFAQRILGVRHDRSDVDLAVGHFLTPSLDLRAIGSWAHTHGGIELPPAGTPEADALRNSIYWPHHDQLGRESYVDVGGGVGYVLTGSVDVFASYVTTVWGKNSHKIKHGFNVGFSWGFSPTQVVRRFFPRSRAAAAEAP
jgi:hypothetical protein